MRNHLKMRNILHDILFILENAQYSGKCVTIRKCETSGNYETFFMTFYSFWKMRNTRGATFWKIRNNGIERPQYLQNNKWKD